MIPDLKTNLNYTEKMFSDYAILPEHAGVALTLWTAHTHATPAFYTTPRLALLSAQPGSGKTRVLELTEHVSANPIMTQNISPAALTRMVTKGNESGSLPPTLLYDEIDALFSPKSGRGTEEIRAMLNVGYKRGSFTYRCVGDSNEVTAFATFAPVALAGLAGHLPETLRTRSIIIEMKKRHSDEKVKPYTIREVEEEMLSVKEFFNKWGLENLETLELARPIMPEGVEDRHAELWEPLLAVADMAGGEWPGKAREACTHFVFKQYTSTPPLGEELLSDIREVMGHGSSEYPPTDRATSVDLLSLLYALEDSPWADLDGRGLSARRLSQLLKPYEVAPVPFRDMATGKVNKGYLLSSNDKQAGLLDAWKRYLPEPAPREEPAPGKVRSLWGEPTPIGQGLKA